MDQSAPISGDSRPTPAGALSFDRCPGSDALKHSLQHALAGRFPQTVLLTGDDPPALHTLAMVVAATLLCERPLHTDGQAYPCGVCAACRKVAAGHHAELRIIDEGDTELKVDLVRQIKAENNVIPSDGNRRVTIIHHAQQLNAAAQNALLKELEEPPAYAFFLLTAENPDALLPTVQSRCTRFVLEPAYTAPAGPPATFATGQPDDVPAAAQALADGVALLRPYLAALAAQQEMQMMRAALALEKVPRRSLASLFGLLQAALRDAIMRAYELPTAPLYPVLQTETTALAMSVPVTRLLSIYDFLFVLTDRVSRNAAAAAVTCALTSDVYQIAFLV